MKRNVATIENVMVFRLLVCGAAIMSTIAINPFTGYDPINLPKMLVLVAFSFPLVPLIILNLSLLKSINRLGIFLTLIFAISIVFIPILSNASYQSQLWGAFGRSTGILTYFSYTILFFAVAFWTIIDDQASTKILQMFERTSYFISCYTIVQYADLDPIKWSQSFPFATFGNINFMSGFLGLANSLFISRLIFQKYPISTQIFYIGTATINSVLIWFTGSIQGLAIMLAVTLACFIMKAIRNRNYLWAGLQFVSSAALGLSAALGSVGIGPLSAFLLQETVIYRMDYWKAGISMFISNPMFGLGIDRYGDHYREFRDIEATIRTGPARVSNTAHNVFIDLLSGGGIAVGGAFLGLVVLALFVSARNLRKLENDSNYALLFSLNLGFFVFCMISIGQIGVVVWGIIFCAASLGRDGSEVHDSKTFSMKTNFDNNRDKNYNIPSKSTPKSKKLYKSRISWIHLGVLLSSFAIGFYLAFIPFKADSKFLSSLRAQSITDMTRSTQLPGISDFHQEKFLEFLIDRSEFDAAIEQALLIKQIYPLNFTANAALLNLPNVPKIEKVAAAKELLEIDPNNSELISDAQKVLLKN